MSLFNFLRLLALLRRCSFGSLVGNIVSAGVSFAEAVDAEDEHEDDERWSDDYEYQEN